MSQRRLVIRIVTALATTIVLSFIALQHTSADIGRFIPTWRMIGHDVANTRSQPFEARISRRNVDRLSPRWTYTTAGDVSATPAVDNEADKERGRGHRRLVVYFPDWGGMLWKLEAETGKILWSRLDLRLQRHRGLDLANQPRAGRRTGARRGSERQHDGSRRRDRETCGG